MAKNNSLKSVLLGLLIGFAPAIVCAALFYLGPYLVSGNPGALLSFAVMGLFVISSIGAFVLAIILIVKNQALKGGCALIAQAIQTILIFSFLAGV